jgi:ATP-dependent DNA helicase RecG
LNPDLFSQAKLGIKPSLKTLEPYKLELLILEDLKHNGKSKLSDIQKRLPEVPIEDVKKMIYKMVGKEIETDGAKRNRTYVISKKK